MTRPAENQQTVEALALAAELQEALDDPKRGEWGGYPWEHLGDAEKDVRVLLAALHDLVAQAELTAELGEAAGKRRKAGHSDTCDYVKALNPPLPCSCGHAELCDAEVKYRALARLDGAR